LNLIEVILAQGSMVGGARYGAHGLAGFLREHAEMGHGNTHNFK
jgi:hypothetical protein